MSRIFNLNTVTRCSGECSWLGFSGTGYQGRPSLSLRLPEIVKNTRKHGLSFRAAPLSISNRNVITHHNDQLVDRYLGLSVSVHSFITRQLLPRDNLSDKVIKDVTLYDRVYHLPVYNQCLIIDKVELPCNVKHRTVADPPAPGIHYIDPVDNSLRKEAKKMSVLRIRHKKMKKHKLRKLRKRMRFIMRKKRALKAKRKEKALQDFEMVQAKWARDFDAEKVIDGHLEKAREAGWGIDILAEYSNKRKAASGSN